MKYQVWHVKEVEINGTVELQDKMLQKYDSRTEAEAYVLKVGDRNILATIKEVA